MDFRGPAHADYANVRSLNRTFLGMLRSSGAGARLRSALPSMIEPQLVGLTDLQIERLSGCPFLLLSFREGDVGYWQRLLSDEPTGDLWAEPPGDGEDQIVEILVGVSGDLEVEAAGRQPAVPLPGIVGRWPVGRQRQAGAPRLAVGEPRRPARAGL